jgi:hypothetical protein
MIATSCKAIETRYKGYRFRSRLEARWAVFLDALGIRYEYEKEGFDLGDAGYYLPDFWLPDVFGGLWVEIKPVAPTDEEVRKMEALTAITGDNGVFRVGDPALHVLRAQGDRQADDAIDYDSLSWYADGMQQDVGYEFCECPWCGKVGIAFEGRGERVCGWEKHYETEKDAARALNRTHDRASRCFTGASYRLVQAAEESRSARFEHGENPRYSLWQ